MSINESMTALANAIRAKAGVSGALTIEGMTAAVDGISVGSEVYIIPKGTYTLSPTLNTNVTPFNAIGTQTYFFADILLYNTTKLAFSYGIYINNGQVMTLSNPQYIIGTLMGTVIYENGAYKDAYSNKYKVAYDMAVPKEFYDWWVANTV